MPDWEYVLWDMQKIKDIDSVWLRECIENRKWAFAADFVRLWAVYHEGGIYLDSDVLAFRSLEPFLHHSMFIGRENVHYCTFDEGVKVFLTSHCFGAEAGHPFLSLNLQYYNQRHFVCSISPDLPPSLRYDMLMMPYIQSVLAESFGYNSILNADVFQQLTCGVSVYPSCYFGGSKSSRLTSSNYVQHLGQGSWRPDGYNELRSQQIYTIGYKIKWRVIRLCNSIFQKFGYCLFKIKIDGYE